MKKILVIAVGILALGLLATPVLAIGPMNAEKSNNPHLFFSDYGVSIRLPPGAINEWINQVADVSHVQMKKAAEFHMEKVFVPSSVDEILLNKWNLLSEDVFFEFLLSVDFEPAAAAYIAYVAMAGGVYYKEVYTGQ